MSNLFETAVVSKRNVLNELRSNNMTMQELRFFSIYLSKINPRDVSTRNVRFSVEEFKRIMGFGKINIGQLRASIDSLLCKVVHVPDENGRGLRAFQLFKECHLFQNDDSEWVIEIDAHDRALPLMFEFKDRYFSYQLWNALRLKSPNQLRMYEILKQYEKIGFREIKVEELRELLGIPKNEYERFERFRVRVLDSCQKALEELTDICYTYERGKTGRGGKWLSIKFHISKNKKYADPLSLKEFIEIQPPAPIIDIDEEEVEEEIDYGSELANLLGDVSCNNEFTKEQIKYLRELVLKVAPPNDIERCDYLRQKFHKMNTYEVKNKFRYICKMLENEIEENEQ